MLKCTSSLKSDGINWSERSLSSKEIPHLFNVMKIHVSKTHYYDLPFFIAGLTCGDPILRTGNPLSVELGPGKLTSRKTTTFFLIPSFILIINLI